MTTELVKFDDVIQQSGLAIQEGEEIKQSYLPFAMQLAEIQEQSAKIDFQNPGNIDEVIARELRLKTVKIRTGAADLKDSRKKIHLLKGNLEQAAYNLIAASCKLTEDTFTNVEKAREIAEAKRQAELKITRDAETLPMAEFIPFGFNLGKMSEQDYQKLLAGAMLQKQAKLERERKAEEDRIAAELARIEEEKRIREENERLRVERRAAEEQLRIEREKVEQERKVAEEKTRKERESIEEKAEQERKAHEARFEQERKAAAEFIRIEKEAREKAENQIREKAEQERKAAAAKLLAEKKAKAAPDKTKLIALSATISGIVFPEMATIEGMAVCESVRELLRKTNEFITKKVGEL